MKKTKQNSVTPCLPYTNRLHFHTELGLQYISPLHIF